jgi:hypothetical protein
MILVKTDHPYLRMGHHSSSMPFQDYPDGGYDTSPLSQYDQDEFSQEDHIDVENEVMEVSRMSGMNSESKIKGQSKNFGEEEDNLLISGWLNVGHDPVDGNQPKNATFWGRIEKYFHEHRTFKSDRICFDTWVIQIC